MKSLFLTATLFCAGIFTAEAGVQTNVNRIYCMASQDSGDQNSAEGKIPFELYRTPSGEIQVSAPRGNIFRDAVSAFSIRETKPEKISALADLEYIEFQATVTAPRMKEYEAPIFARTFGFSPFEEKEKIFRCVYQINTGELNNRRAVDGSLGGCAPQGETPKLQRATCRFNLDETGPIVPKIFEVLFGKGF